MAIGICQLLSGRPRPGTFVKVNWMLNSRHRSDPRNCCVPMLGQDCAIMKSIARLGKIESRSWFGTVFLRGCRNCCNSAIGRSRASAAQSLQSDFVVMHSWTDVENLMCVTHIYACLMFSCSCAAISTHMRPRVFSPSDVIVFTHFILQKWSLSLHSLCFYSYCNLLYTTTDLWLHHAPFSICI